MIISSMTMTEKIGKNFSSHPRARDESTWWIPGCYWLWRCSEVLVLAELHTSAPVTGARPAPSLRHLTTFISPSTDCECKNPPCFVTCDVKTFKAKHRKHSLSRSWTLHYRETGSWRNESSFMTRGSGSGWLIFPDLLTLTLAPLISLYPGARVRIRTWRFTGLMTVGSKL